MTPGTIHDLTLSTALQEVSGSFAVRGDGSPEKIEAEDNKDLQYWSFGRMMMHHRNMHGGFDRLSIAGLPAFRAVQNMQCLTGSGLTVPVTRYVGAEWDQDKLWELAEFYTRINRKLPTFRKIDVELGHGDILELLKSENRKFNVFDFDFMDAPNGWTAFESKLPKDRMVIEKPGAFIFLKLEKVDAVIEAVKYARGNGPVAVYCNWSMGRQMSMEDWERLRRAVLARFQARFEVFNWRWTYYMGNTRMVGIQLILGRNADTLKKAGPLAGLKMVKVSKIAGRRVKALRKEIGLTQLKMAEEIGISQHAMSAWERKGVGPLTLVPHAVDNLRAMLEEHGI